MARTAIQTLLDAFCDWAGISQRELARIAHLDRRMIDSIIDGSKKPGLISLSRLYQVMSTRLSEAGLEMSEESFYNIAGYSTQEQRTAAERSIEKLIQQLQSGNE